MCTNHRVLFLHVVGSSLPFIDLLASFELLFCDLVCSRTPEIALASVHWARMLFAVKYTQYGYCRPVSTINNKRETLCSLSALIYSPIK